MTRTPCLLIALLSPILILSFTQSANGQIDRRLRQLLMRHGVETPDTGGGHTKERIELGQALFFDRELSGNRDTSCATCHHPQLAAGDGLALPVGTGPQTPGTLGLDRVRGSDREFVPRNAPEVFNRGSSLWKSMFWDSRVAEDENGNFVSPAGDDLLDGLDSVLYIQAMFPVTSRDEMRGNKGDLTFQGDENEIAEIPDEDLRGIWSALMERLMKIPEYQTKFEAAYPEKKWPEMTFADAANAIGAFEIDAFTMLDTPFDQYLDGDDSALSQPQKRGALLFYGRAGCVKCHSGPLLTDQRHWALAVPQLGPGKSPYQPYDLGRFLVNGRASDAFAFRTPPLRNVAKTGPYFHNGAFNDLRAVVKHHANPIISLLRYNPTRNLVQPELEETVLSDWRSFVLLASTLDARRLPRRLRRNEVNDLVSFLESLTAPDFESSMEAVIPDRVPSGLPVEKFAD
jgi:cytochrome c peroxidase